MLDGANCKKKILGKAREKDQLESRPVNNVSWIKCQHQQQHECVSYRVFYYKHILVRSNYESKISYLKCYFKFHVTSWNVKECHVIPPAQKITPNSVFSTYDVILFCCPGGARQCQRSGYFLVKYYFNFYVCLSIFIIPSVILKICHCCTEGAF